VTRKASGRNYSTFSKYSNKTDTVTVISDEPYGKNGTEAGEQKAKRYSHDNVLSSNQQ
jgi:hypothetical protein